MEVLAEVASTKMRTEGLKATKVVIIFSVLLGRAVAVDSMLTRGGHRLAEKAEAERAAFYADSGGKTWPLAPNAKEKVGRRGGIHHPDSVRAKGRLVKKGAAKWWRETVISSETFPSQ